MSTKNIKNAGKKQEAELKEGYDQAEKEKKTPKSDVEIMGKTFKVVSIAPEWVQLFVARYGRGKDKDVPADKYMDFLVKVLGDDIIDHMLDQMDNETEGGKLESAVEAILAVWTPKDAKKKK